jgi:type 1 glutamine amidotransferase
MARIMAHRFGFSTTVLFTLDEEGFIEPGSSNIDGMEILRAADLLVVGLRFQDFPPDQMQHLVDYLDRAGPVVGIRTSTHAFRIEEGPYRRYSWDYDGLDYESGFGRQVLGETWVGHYGTNHEQSSRLLIEEANADHPILRGVADMHVVSGGYNAVPPDDVTVLARGEVLNGMEADAPPDPEKERLPVAWTRTYGHGGRVFTTTHGASEDFLNPGFRRLMINGALWAVGLEDAITADADVDLVGPYHPARYAFDGYRIGVRPSDLAGWDTPIMSPDKPTTREEQ